MQVATDEAALKLHVAAGTVWCAAGDQSVVCSGMSPEAFLSRVLANSARIVRVLATQDNAALIASLYELRHRGAELQIELGTPRFAKTEAERLDPHVVFMRMRQDVLNNAAPSQGGWHVMADLEYPAYAIARELQFEKPDRDMLQTLLKMHPAYHALAFIPHLDQLELCRLLGTIRDPRWFTDPHKPNSSNRLLAYLGLHPKTMQFVAEGGDAWGHVERCRNVRNVWRTSDGVDVNVLVRAGYFLWRAWRDKSPGWVADLRVSQMFIKFLVGAWLSGLYHQRYALFDPSTFFDDVTAAAYHQHLADMLQGGHHTW